MAAPVAAFSLEEGEEWQDVALTLEAEERQRAKQAGWWSRYTG